MVAALDHRNRTGEGQYIDLSQAETSQQFLAPALLDYFANSEVLSRTGNASPDYAPHGVYPVEGEDRWIAIAVTNDEQWAAFCDVIGKPDWIGDSALATAAGRVARCEALDATVAEWTRGKDVEALEQLLQSRGIPAHRVAGSSDAFADPQLEARGHFVQVEHPEMGTIPVEASRMVFSETPAVVSRPGPTFGQDNDYVLREVLGLSEDEIVEFVAAGALN